MDSGTARMGAIGAGLPLLLGLLVAEAATPECIWREQWFWFVPLFVLGLALSLFAALSFVSRYVYELPRVPTVAERRATKLTAEEHERQGRANQRAGLEEILVELNQTSSQLKHELRHGERGMLFPRHAWTKNQHLVTGETRALLEDLYEQTHRLDLLARHATTAVMDAEETAQRQRVKQAVDAAHEEVRRLRDEVEP